MITKIKVKKSAKIVKRMLVFLFFVTTMAVWCKPSFAARQVIGAGVTESLDATNTGSIDGVTLGDAASTLNIDNGGSIAWTGAGGSISGAGIINHTVSGTMAGDVGATGLNVAQVNVNTGATAVNFNGTVFATAISVAAGNTATFNSLGANRGATNFTGAGATISLATNTILTGAMTTNTDNTGTLSLASGSRLVGAVTGIAAINVLGGTNTAGVSAIVQGATGSHSFSLLTNTLNINGGAMTIATNGTINTTIASPTVYGQIVVQDGYESNLGTGLQIVVTAPSGVLIPLGTLFNIVQSTSGTGAPATVNYAAAQGYEFTIATSTAGDAVLLTSKVGGAQAAVPVAAPLAALVASAASSPDLLGVLANINALSGSAQDNANAQLAPSTPSLAAPLVTYQGAREFQNLWLSRLDGCGQVSWPSEDKENCKGKDARSGWWLKGFGYFGDQDARAASTGYHSTIIGSMLAYDVPVGLNTRAGLGFGYARSAIKGKTFDARTDFDTYQGTAYIGHELGPWFVDGSASFGWNEYSDKRHIQFTGEDRRANAKYSGQTYTAFGRTGFHIPAPKKFIVTPIASLQYTRVNIDGYMEKGANDLSLKVESQHYNYLESGLGAKVERSFNFSRLSLVPELRFEWLHMLSNPKLAQSSAYTPAGSESTKTDGLHTVADTYHVGTGLTLLSCACSATRWSLEGGYDYYWRTDGYAANQVTARVTARF